MDRTLHTLIFLLAILSLVHDIDLAELPDKGKNRLRPPTNVHLERCTTGDQVVLAWTPSNENNEPVTQMIIYYNTSFDEPGVFHEETRARPGSDSAFVELTPWVNYTFHVKAENRFGKTSDPSEFTTLCATMPDRPLKNPTNVCTKSIHPNKLVITWQRMNRTDHNAKGFHYIIGYKLNQPGAEQKIQHVYDWKQRQLVIENQETFKEYEIYVEAANDLGTTQKSRLRKIIGYSGEGVPRVTPSGLAMEDSALSATSAVFTWDPVNTTSQAMNGLFTGYEIRPYTSRVSISQITNWCKRRLSGLAMEDSALSATSAVFTWDPVNTTSQAMNGLFTGYEIHYWRDDDPDNVRTHQVPRKSGKLCRFLNDQSAIGGDRPDAGFDQNPGTERPDGPERTHVSDLWPFSQISAAILVRNSLNKGELSSPPITFSTPESVPGVVSTFSLSRRASHQLEVTWSPPKEPNGIIIGYTIGHREATDSSSPDVAKIQDPSQMSYTIGNLTSNTSYILHIWAETSKGLGMEFLIEASTLADEVPTTPVIKLPRLRAPDETSLLSGDTSTLPDDTATTGEGPIVLESREEVQATATVGWFVGLMSTISVLLLVLLIVCLIKRSNTGKYRTYEMDDEKEDFCAYSNPSEPDHRKSATSLGSDIFDRDSIMQSDFNLADFNESASYIGVYIDESDDKHLILPNGNAYL